MEFNANQIVHNFRNRIAIFFSLFFLFFRENATKLLNSLETFTREAKDEYPENWNGKNMRKYGFKLCQGLKAFAESDYEEAFKLLKPIRHSIYTRTFSSLVWNMSKKNSLVPSKKAVTREN